MNKLIRLNTRHKKMTQSAKEILVLPEVKTDSLSKTAKGETKVFGEVYCAYLDQIYRYVFYQVKDKMIAEDLTEEIFLKAWKTMGSCRGEGPIVLSWLYRIAHNHVIDYFRTEHSHTSLDSEIVHDNDLLNRTWDVQQEVERQLLKQKVLELISCLPVQQRQIIILKFIEGLDNREISSIVNKKEGAIRVMQMRALEILRQKLLHEEQDTEEKPCVPSFQKSSMSA